ncbi:Regulator of nonsense transcripts 1like [Caligus rogercresseyi]|uniref:Regulator of nonsense transcripts 1like n=1 Tax=Caligus rogercresseyi TaxID=217165 RepID=A0A7T8JXJ7_CALRO|nr:Regulator of nonsense transcripts 1like [Caligus rogercresseyi]
MYINEPVRESLPLSAMRVFLLDKWSPGKACLPSATAAPRPKWSLARSPFGRNPERDPQSADPRLERVLPESKQLRS